MAAVDKTIKDSAINSRETQSDSHQHVAYEKTASLDPDLRSNLSQFFFDCHRRHECPLGVVSVSTSDVSTRFPAIVSPPNGLEYSTNRQMSFPAQEHRWL
jgi:hypothetical protein